MADKLRVNINRETLPDGKVRLTITDPQRYHRMGGPQITEPNAKAAEETIRKLDGQFKVAGNEVEHSGR